MENLTKTCQNIIWQWVPVLRNLLWGWACSLGGLRDWVLHGVSLWNTSVLWEQRSVTCPYLFPLKIPGCKLSLLEKPGLTDKLSHEPKDCFSKAFVCSTPQPANFLGTKLTLSSLLSNTCSVVILLFFYCASFYAFSHFQMQSFKFLWCLFLAVHLFQRIQHLC